MNLSDWLESINFGKNNLIRSSHSPEVAQKLYAKFPIARSMSYSMDCILLVNELNARDLANHGLSNLQHYEFLLNVIPKKKRYGKWEKPEVPEEVKLLQDLYGYSYEKAREAANVLTEEQLADIKKSLEKGGSDGSEKRKRSSKK